MLSFVNFEDQSFIRSNQYYMVILKIRPTSVNINPNWQFESGPMNCSKLAQIFDVARSLFTFSFVPRKIPPLSLITNFKMS